MIDGGVATEPAPEGDCAGLADTAGYCLWMMFEWEETEPCFEVVYHVIEFIQHYFQFLNIVYHFCLVFLLLFIYKL